MLKIFIQKENQFQFTVYVHHMITMNTLYRVRHMYVNIVIHNIHK